MCPHRNSGSSLPAVRCTFPFFALIVCNDRNPNTHVRAYRADEKYVKDFNIQAGAVLHLVLALRGGAC